MLYKNTTLILRLLISFTLINYIIIIVTWKEIPNGWLSSRIGTQWHMVTHNKYVYMRTVLTSYYVFNYYMLFTRIHTIHVVSRVQ